VRSALLSGLFLLLLAGCVLGGDGEPSAQAGDRTFRVGEMAIRADGRILLAGVATRGDWDSKQDDYCRGEGPATSDFAVVHLSPAGRVVASYSLSEAELDGCAVDVTRAELDPDGALVLNGVVRESPGLIPGEGGPEARERDYAARFGPEPEEDFDADESEEDGRTGTELAALRLPGGDWLVIEEDPGRWRAGAYLGIVSLRRWSDGESPLWSFPVWAISPKAGLEDEEGRGWGLFHDARGGFYGFVHYWLNSGDREVVLFRHRSDGRPDPSFGERGRVLVARGFVGEARALRVPGGDFVVAVERGTGGRVIVRRYTPGGEPVRRFGRQAGEIDCGVVAALRIQADGKLVLACSKRGPTTVVRLLPTGHLDRSFGRDGKVVVRRV
jgi:uncharacterized delta-60 repeat protein